MKLCNATIRPGTVRSVAGDGTIKANAPGLFNEVDSIDLLPPIMPFFMGSNANSYSKPLPFEEVWIINFTDNPRQLYWFRKDRNTSKNIPFCEQHVEVVCNKDVNGEWCTIYFSDGSGWVIGKGDSVINITANGEIVLTNGLPYRCIEINSENISIGSKGKSSHPVAFGDKTENALMEIINLFSKIQFTSMLNPHTAPIGTIIATSIEPLAAAVSQISSDNVTVE